MDVKTTAIAYDWATGRQVRTVRDPGGHRRHATTPTATRSRATCRAGCTSLPGGRGIDYFADGVPVKQTVGGAGLTWARDPADRVRSETTSAGAVTVHHYGSAGDQPAWLVGKGEFGEKEVVRNVIGASGELGALTAAGGSVRLQLLTVGGSVGTELDLGTGAATVLGYDEYGVASQPSRYGWLGGKLYSTTPDGTVLIAGRLYDPRLGRFLQRPY